jgi:hypothetical protein
VHELRRAAWIQFKIWRQKVNRGWALRPDGGLGATAPQLPANSLLIQWHLSALNREMRAFFDLLFAPENGAQRAWPGLAQAKKNA